MKWRHQHWRTILSRAPLPTLAAAAAWGVWSFQVLFTPWYVAGISALSFELTYISLAVVQLDTLQRRRATAISIGAVVVSVVYNSLSALFAIRPALLVDRPLWGDVLLSLAHGMPLAIVAFLVADLLLHTPAPAAVKMRVIDSDTIAPERPRAAVKKRASTLSKTARVKRYADTHQMSESQVWRRVKSGQLVLNGKE
jgi:hypothetical protein